MIFLQEEIDWSIYVAYGFAESSCVVMDSPSSFGIDAGQRPFEIISGVNNEGFDVPLNIPEEWPKEVKSIWQLRMNLIKSKKDLRLIEHPHYKRRWIGRQGLFNHAQKKEGLKNACRKWLLDSLENMTVWQTEIPELISCARLADQLHHDRDFMQVAELYRGRPDFDLTELVVELVIDAAMPFLPVMRYKPSGLRKRVAWERTWDLQRQEDKGTIVGDIPVPPKYISGDFKKSNWWKLRGKLDVPKERFIIYSHCEKSSDPTPVICWAGWNHLQQAQALASYLLTMKENEGWPEERLIPLVAGLIELLPWLKQWHNDVDPTYGTGMGDYFEGFIDEELRSLELTAEAVNAWEPPQVTKRRGRRKKTG
jgi:hypothetical protein